MSMVLKTSGLIEHSEINEFEVNTVLLYYCCGDDVHSGMVGARRGTALVRDGGLPATTATHRSERIADH